MRRLGALVLSLLLALAVWPATGRAADGNQLAVRLGDHRKFGRLVVAGAEAAAVTWSRNGDSFVLKAAVGFDDAGIAGEHVPGVVSVRAEGGMLTVRMQTGAKVHAARLDERVVVDFTPVSTMPIAAKPVAGPPAVAPKLEAPGAPTITDAGVLPGLPAPMVAVLDGPRPTQASARPASPTGSATAAAPAMAQASPVPAVGVRDGAALSIAASMVQPSGDQPGGLLLPFDQSVGVAAFEQGGHFKVVFDSLKPIDLGGVSADQRFGRARFVLLVSGALLDIPCDGRCAMHVCRVADGWLVTPEPLVPAAADPEATTDGLVFPFTRPGRVVVVRDDTSGVDTLVGTVRDPDHGVVNALRTPGLRVVPTALGIAVERFADTVDLRVVAKGFLLTDPSGPLGRVDLGTPAAFSRAVELWAVPPEEQWRRYKAALAEAASYAPGSRRPARLAAARSALALGLGREARRLSTIADADAPKSVDQAQSAFLAAAGSYLARDQDAPALLDDPKLGGSDEVALWRGLASARQQPDDHAAARAIAGRLALLQAYPVGLRRALAGDAALALARGGDQAARALVASLPDDSGGVRFARALVAGAGHRDVAALGALDRLAGEDDPAIAFAAATEAVETRLQAGLISPAQAAKLLQQHIYDGRMAGQELPVRLRVAALKAQASDWSGSLADLRQTSQQFPEALPAIRQAAGAAITALSSPGASAGKAGGAEAAPETLRAVALLEDYRDLLPPDLDRAALSVGLADRLVSLDLPDRAAALLREAVAPARPGAEQARDGLALARLLMDGGDTKAARAALDDVDRSGLPPSFAPERALLDAKLLAAGGDRDGALAALATLQDPVALDLKATILADAKNWQAEVPVLSALLAARVPGGPHARPTLAPEVQDLVLRIASAMERAGQTDALHQFGQDWGPSVTDPSRRAMLDVLAAPSVTSVADLTRSGADLATTRSALTLLDGHGGSGGRQPM